MKMMLYSFVSTWYADVTKIADKTRYLSQCEFSGDNLVSGMFLLPTFAENN